VIIKNSSRSLALALALIACGEGRGEADPRHEGERDAQPVGPTPSDAGAGEASVRDVDSPADTGVVPPMDAAPDAQDSWPPRSDGAATFDDAEAEPYKWYDSAVPPPNGAWPVDAQVRTPGDAGNDPQCMTSILVNSRGVGADCLHATRDQTCFTTRTCSEALAIRGLAMPTPYYCTRPCRQHSDCGEMATCCSLPGLDEKACILDGCRYSCR
jgi:hypothetical protein